MAAIAMYWGSVYAQEIDLNSELDDIFIWRYRLRLKTLCQLMKHQV